jgi:hypothetical protein
MKNTAKRIELLTELHRPLEEHWAAAPRLGLDAKGSDYVYKFHVARLQDIYSGQELGPSGQIQSSGVKEIANESPATQLYGVRGLLTEMTPGKLNYIAHRQRQGNFTTFYIVCTYLHFASNIFRLYNMIILCILFNNCT